MKTFWIGLGAVILSIAIPALALIGSRAHAEKVANSVIEEILIRCPTWIADDLRESYEKEIHPWAISLTRDIVEDRGQYEIDLGLYKRLVLSALTDRIIDAGFGEAVLALRLAASGVDTSTIFQWSLMEDRVDPAIEPLFSKPTIEQTDNRGRVTWQGPATPPPSRITISTARPSHPVQPDRQSPGQQDPVAITQLSSAPQKVVGQDDPAASNIPEKTVSTVADPPSPERDPQGQPPPSSSRSHPIPDNREIFDLSPDQLAVHTIQAGPKSAKPISRSAPDPHIALTIARNFLNAGTRASRMALSRSPRLTGAMLEEFFWPEADGPIAYIDLQPMADTGDSSLPARIFLATMADGSERMLPIVTTPHGASRVDVAAFTRHAPLPVEDMLANPGDSEPGEFRVFVEAFDPAGEARQRNGNPSAMIDHVFLKLNNPDWSSGPLFAKARRNSEAGTAALQLIAKLKKNSPEHPQRNAIPAIVVISADETTRDTRQVTLKKIICRGWVKP